MDKEKIKNKIQLWLKNNYLVLIIFTLAILLRFYLIPFTLGVDTVDMYYMGNEMVDQNKGIYEIQHPIAWPPLYPWIIKACFSLWRHFFSQETFSPALRTTSFDYLSLTTIFKIPPFLAEMAIGVFIYLIFLKLGKQKKGLIALSLWFFSPVSFIINTMWGKFDVISVLFVVMTAYLFLLKKYSWAALSLGIGVATNMWPLLLAPVIFFKVARQSWLKAFGILLIIILPIIIISLPYLAKMPHTYLDVLSGKKGIGEQDWIFGWRPEIYWFVPKPITLSIFFALVFLLSASWKFKDRAEQFCAQSLIILATFFVFSPYAPQFLIWFYPLLIIEAVNNYKKMIIWLGATLAIVGMFFFWGGKNALSINMFNHDDLMAQIINWKRSLDPERYKLTFEAMSALFTGAMLSYLLLILKSNFIGLPKTKK